MALGRALVRGWAGSGQMTGASESNQMWSSLGECVNLSVQEVRAGPSRTDLVEVCPGTGSGAARKEREGPF